MPSSPKHHRGERETNFPGTAYRAIRQAIPYNRNPVVSDLHFCNKQALAKASLLAFSIAKARHATLRPSQCDKGSNCPPPNYTIADRPLPRRHPSSSNGMWKFDFAPDVERFFFLAEENRLIPHKFSDPYSRTFLYFLKVFAY